jgi:GNAT superfamily N-acetyltransferase
VIFAALSEAAERNELILSAGGLCRYHLRRDGVVTIRELLVLPQCRRGGLGSALVTEVARRHSRAVLRASCPSDSAANGFWARLGFLLVAEGKINRWERQP